MEETSWEMRVSGAETYDKSSGVCDEDCWPAPSVCANVFREVALGSHEEDEAVALPDQTCCQYLSERLGSGEWLT